MLLYCLFYCKIHCNFNFQEFYSCYFCSVFFFFFIFTLQGLLLYINWIFFTSIQYLLLFLKLFHVFYNFFLFKKSLFSLSIYLKPLRVRLLCNCVPSILVCNSKVIFKIWLIILSWVLLPCDWFFSDCDIISYSFILCIILLIYVILFINIYSLLWTCLFVCPFVVFRELVPQCFF